MMLFNYFKNGEPFLATAMAIFSGVMGSSQKRSPVALYTASAMAGRGVFITTSPMDFAPKGPSPS